MLEKIFKIKEKNTSVKTEVIAGATTFLTMAYVIFVHPTILGAAGMDKGALITVTCIATFIGSLLSGLWVNSPIAMAPGMGLNAFFTYTLVKGSHLSWETSLGVVFISGIAFLILTVTGFREKVMESIPQQLRLAVGAGIGLFIAFIGAQNLGIVVSNPDTLVGLGKMTPQVLLGLIGLIIIAFLEIKKIRGGILIGIITTTLLGVIFHVVPLPEAIISRPPSIAPIAFKLDIIGALKISLIGPIFSFMFVDLFDSIGTIMACASEAKIIDEDGNIEGIGRLLEADAAATIIGSVLGTSTTTTYVESAAGISAGGRTGLASVVTGTLFLLAPFFTPLIGIVPAFATAPALIIVGGYMFKHLLDIDFHDMEIAIPCFLTILIMPFTYSISTGISFGFLSFIIISVFMGDMKKIKPVMWLIGILSVLQLTY